MNVQVYQPAAKAHVKNFAIVLVGYGEGYWAPSKYIAFVDNNTDVDVLQEMRALLGEEYGVDLLTSRRVNMTEFFSRGGASVEIPGVLDYEIEAIRSRAVSKSVMNHIYPWLTSPQQWKTKVVE